MDNMPFSGDAPDASRARPDTNNFQDYILPPPPPRAVDTPAPLPERRSEASDRADESATAEVSSNDPFAKFQNRYRPAATAPGGSDRVPATGPTERLPDTPQPKPEPDKPDPQPEPVRPRPRPWRPRPPCPGPT